MKRENEIYLYDDGIRRFAIKVASVKEPLDLGAESPITAICYQNSMISLSVDDQYNHVKRIPLTDAHFKQLGFQVKGSIYTWIGNVGGEQRIIKLLSKDNHYLLDITKDGKCFYTLPFDYLDMLQTLVFQFLKFEMPIALAVVDKYCRG